MKIAFLALALVAGCSSSTTADLGCLGALGEAETSFNDAAHGIGNGTSTEGDLAKSYGTVSKKLSTLAEVNDDAEIKAKASDGSVLAGRLRVAKVDATPVDLADITALREDINALDARCVKLGKG